MTTPPAAPDMDDPREFVKSVLLVDDRAFTSPHESSAGDDEAPDTAAADDLYGDAEPIAPAQAAGRSDAPDPDGVLQVQAIVNGYAELGVSCTLLAPTVPTQADITRVVTLAVSSDVVILDWILRPADNRNDRQTSEGLLRDIIAEDRRLGGRLRLVIVYTGDKKPEQVSSDLQDVLQGSGTAVERLDPLSLKGGSRLRVVVVSKPTSGIPDAVDGAALPEHSRRLFCEAFANGLLPRVALSGVAGMRRYAHRLLSRFSGAMDPAYLSHRALTGPVAAEQFARQLVADEFAAVLAACRVEKAVHQAHVDEVVERLLPGGKLWLPGSKFGSAQQVDSEWAAVLLKKGRNDDPAVRWPNSRSTVTALFSDVPGKDGALRWAVEKDEHFAILSAFARSSQTDDDLTPAPVLTLGTVLQQRVKVPFFSKVEPKYWLCIQPLCDSARSTKGRAFPMLPLSVVSDESRDFDLVAPGRGQSPPVRLQLDLHLYKAFLPTFPQDGAVFAQWNDGDKEWRFYDEAGLSYRWVGDLRMDQAHRFAALVGNRSGRIGLDELEWQRKRARRD